jgi:hypothetical protein
VIIVVGILLAVAVFGTIGALLVRRQLREKYAVLWLIVGSVLILLSSFPELLVGMTHLLGVEVPANLIFALAIVLLIGVCLHLSWELSRSEEKVRRLVEEQTLTRLDVDRLLAAVEVPERPRGSVRADQSGGLDGDAVGDGVAGKTQ